VPTSRTIIDVLAVGERQGAPRTRRLRLLQSRHSRRGVEEDGPVVTLSQLREHAALFMCRLAGPGRQPAAQVANIGFKIP